MAWFSHSSTINAFLIIFTLSHSIPKPNIKPCFPVKRIMTLHIEQRGLDQVLPFPGIDGVEGRATKA